MNINKFNLSRLGKVAICYAQFYHLRVFPLVPKRTEPLTSNGFHSVTIDINQIFDWWTKNPNVNVGIRTGKESRIVVIDIDGTGYYSLGNLLKQYAPLLNTIESVTGSGGNHILFKYPNFKGIQVTNRVDLLGGNSKINIQGEGDYIVALPTIHQNGRKYEWEMSSRPNDIEMAKMPSWLLNIVCSHNQRKFKKDLSYWKDIVSSVDEDSRNNVATSIVGHLSRRYVDPMIIIEFKEIWNKRNNPPLSAKELESVILSVWRKEQVEREKRWDKWII